jgi:histidinol dehydrogenase
MSKGVTMIKDFLNLQAFQKISKNAMKKLAKTALKLSKIEGLTANKE